MITTITVEKNFKSVVCGTIDSYKDAAGNPMYDADRVVDGQKFTFYTYGAAELWLRLGGLLHG
jgi:hypothetical protein